MMNKTRSRFSAALLGVAVMPLLLIGCGRSTGDLSLTSYKDALTPENFSVDVEDCFYYSEPDGDYHFLAQARYAPDGRPDDEVLQLLHVHVFWKPWPGKTHDNPSMIDAILRYAVITPGGAAIYSGAGYAYPKKKRRGDDITLMIEDGRLNLDSRYGDAPDILGPSRIVGKLNAVADQAQAVGLRRELDLHAGR